MPHQRTPVRTTVQLFKDLENLLIREDEVLDLALRRIEREAKQTMSVDAGSAHEVLGSVAALRSDPEATEKHYEIAFQMSGDMASTWHNYSVSLGNLGRMDDAYNAARRAWEGSPDNHVFLGNYIEAALEAAYFSVAVDLCERWRKAGFERPAQGYHMEVFETAARLLADAVARGVFTERAAREVLSAAHGVRSRAQLRRYSAAVLLDPTEPDTFLHVIYLMVTPERAARLNEQFVDWIVEQDHLLQTDPGRAFIVDFVGTQVDGGISTNAA